MKTSPSSCPPGVGVSQLLFSIFEVEDVVSRVGLEQSTFEDAARLLSSG